MSELRMLTPENCRFSRSETGALRTLIDDDFCCLQVVLRRLFPLRKPNEYVSVADGEHEIGIIEDLRAFDAETRQWLEAELDVYYAVPTITAIHGLKVEYGYYHWRTSTDRGDRDFYVKGRTDNVKAAGVSQLFVTDIHNCRYRINDVAALPGAGRALLDLML